MPGPKSIPRPLKISKLRLEKTCGTQWSTLQTEPYVATYVRKPLRAWIGLEPISGMDRTRTHGRRCAEASDVFSPGKISVLLGENVFWVGKHVFWPQNRGRRCAEASSGFPREKRCYPGRQGVFWGGETCFLVPNHGRRCAEASGVFFPGKKVSPWEAFLKVTCLKVAHFRVSFF